jgi:hypothetical protein
VPFVRKAIPFFGRYILGHRKQEVLFTATGFHEIFEWFTDYNQGKGVPARQERDLAITKTMLDIHANDMQNTTGKTLRSLIVDI